MSGETSANSASAGGVRVRMYNVSFGDCFLLTFPGNDGADHYMLIDCGTIGRDKESRQMMEKVVADIVDYTGNHIDVLVLSHEHADHITGFEYCKEVFEGLSVDQVWLAWTEDPSDEVAKELRLEHESKIKTLRVAEGMLRGVGRAAAGLVGSSLSFELPENMSLTQKNDLVEFLRKKSGRPLKPGDYLKPGQAPLRIPGVDVARVFVLAPPRNETMISVLDRESETYLRVHDVSYLSSFVSAVRDLGASDESDSVWSNKPFDDYYEFIPNDGAKSVNPYIQFLDSHYGSGEEWRRIDVDWLDAAGQLALDVGDETNNTSLVLAIELTASEPKKVILFTGDAQVGSWLSWFDNCWPGEGPDGATVTVDGLLGQVALLKVGHHGSRNATMRKKGLEKMTSGDLVAMIPVNGEVSKKRFKGAHPSPKLLDALKARASGRVLRSDEIPVDQSSMTPPFGYDSEAWFEFTKMVNVHQDRLWVEYTIS